ncbi:MAG: alkaline phosphatase [Rhodospirillales bacterium]
MTDFPARTKIGRRRLLRTAAAGTALPLLRPFAVVASDRMRPSIAGGAMSGDVTATGCIVWSVTDRPARLIVEYATTESFAERRRVVGPAAVADTGFTARVDLAGLPAGQDVFYRAWFQDLGDLTTLSAPASGRFRTAPADRRTVRFGWSGDMVGQGWGIDVARGGMTIFDAMRAQALDFFIHSGDYVYADGPLAPEVALDDGTVWRNLVTPAKAKVAETLDEFRGNYAYNLLDDPFRRFNAEVPVIAQWDDHEVRNNWYPGQRIADDRYAETRADVLAARARQAFLEFTPTRLDPRDPGRIHRRIAYGPHLDVFMLDMRSYRGPNSPNRQATEDPAAAFLGRHQVSWLIRALAASTATWKVIAADMPIGLVVADGAHDFEAVANGDGGPPLGRELEIARLLHAIKVMGVRNVVWLTADVHYAAAHRYDPAAARFADFDPFWEFVAGPLHAGTFGPGTLDPTFGPQVMFRNREPGAAPNRPPSDGLQTFGTVTVDGATGVMTVTLHGRDGARLFAVDLPPAS